MNETRPRDPSSAAQAVQALYHRSALPGLYCSTLQDGGPPRSRVHDRLVLLTLTAGEALVRCRGEVHLLRPGVVLLAEPGEVHRDLRKSACQAELAVVQGDLCAALRGPAAGSFLGPVVVEDAALQKALRGLVAVVRTGGGAAEQERRAALVFQRLRPLWTARTPRPDPPVVARARRIIQEEPKTNLSLQALAARLRCAPTYLCRSFTAHVGLGPHGYQLHCRLLLARAQIEAGMTIAAAADLNGFTDESHLHRHFRRRFAMAPGGYHHALLRRADAQVG